MQKLITLLMVCLTITSIQAQDAPSFPESWAGEYEGTLEIYAAQGLVQSLPMELIIQAIDTSAHYTWTIIYGEDKVAGARHYIIETTDPEKGLYTVDEQNSIRIEGYLRGNLYIQVFTVMESQIITTTEKMEDGSLLWEIIANQTTAVSKTGDSMHEGEEIPEVATFPVSAYQRARLTKKE
ncbi:MAG: hypothetical protein GYB31_15930 [Bacteroidetes bacterium]|nr:hypothetical protein [Bacteroidota bacterium]